MMILIHILKSPGMKLLEKLREKTLVCLLGGHSDMEYLAKKPPEEKPLNLGGVSYTYDEAFAAGWEQSLDGCWHPPKEDKVLKWQLPVELDPSGEYYFTLPDDLLEAAGIKEGDELIWEEQEDGSVLLKK